MKKIGLGIGCVAVVIIGALVIWKFILPFILMMLQGFSSFIK